jgi:hypothetical protein
LLLCLLRQLTADDHCSPLMQQKLPPQDIGLGTFPAKTWTQKIVQSYTTPVLSDSIYAHQNTANKPY